MLITVLSKLFFTHNLFYLPLDFKRLFFVAFRKDLLAHRITNIPL